jgi:hypothetical protein
MPHVSGFLRVTGGRPDQGLPGGGGEIDNTLPGGGWGGGEIDNTLPPPPGIWPPPTTIWPPIALPPDYPMPPGSVWPPVRPPHAGHPLPPGGIAGQPLPPAPGRPDAGLPPGHAPSGKFLVAIVAAAAGGLRVIGYTVVDPSLDVGMPLPPGAPPVAGTPLPPTPEPKR